MFVTLGQSKAFWANLLQHVIRISSTAMVSSIVVGAAGTADGYLPATQVDWIGGFLIGLTAAGITTLWGLTSIVIPGADPDSISWRPKRPSVAGPSDAS